MISSEPESPLVAPPPESRASLRALRYARIVGHFASVQVAVQMIGFATGILLVRRLEQREYAFFTIANTMQGTLNLLADIGISIGLVSVGGHVWQNARRFGQLIQTALRLRRRLALVVVFAVTPILYLMLIRNGASVGYTALVIVIVLLGLGLQLSIGVYGVVPRLRSEIGLIQKIDFSSAVARLVMIVGLMIVFLNAGMAVLAGALALLLQYWLLRRHVVRVIDLDVPPSHEDHVAMLGFIKNQAANAAFYCFQGQITVFLISFFGHRAGAVAEVGALGRLAMIFAVFSNLLANIFVPAFARCHTVRKLRWQYWGIVAAVGAFSAVVLAAAAFFPNGFLLILGNKYGHLQRELLLMVGGAVLGALTGTLWGLNAAKAWISGSWLYIPLTLGTQIALIPFIDFSSVQGVLVFNLVSAVPNFLLNMVLSYRGFRSLRPAIA